MKQFLLILIFPLSIQVHGQDEFTFVFLHKRTDLPKIPKEESEKIMQGHMANIERLAKEDKLVAAGPFEGGGGIFIFKSGSIEQVNEWLVTDPGVQAKRWNIEVLRYYPQIGGVCAVSEPYEMVNYQFVHFRPNVMKFNVQEGEQSVKKHEEFMKRLSATGNVITFASFGGLDGGILVMKGALQQEAILADPAVEAALFEPVFMQLYIAKGAFCEPR